MINSKQKVEELCAKNNWDFTKFQKYFDLITEKNKVVNITGFKDEVLWTNGILESLVFMIQILKNEPKNLRILDIGAGAGFPSIPFALINKDFSITIYEPNEKRVNFLNEVIDIFKLNDRVEIKKIRSEDVKDKNIFDLVVARAVGDVNTMLLSAFHLIKVRGKMCLIKGSKVDVEIKEASDTLNKLKTEAIKEKLQLDINKHDNWIVKIKKIRSTPISFPYKWKEIVKIKSSIVSQKKKS